MVFLVRKMRTLERLKQYKIVTVTDRTDLEVQLRETARLSGDAVRPTDQDLRTRASSTALTQRILSETTPDIVFAMLQKYQDIDRQDDLHMVLGSHLHYPGGCFQPVHFHE